MWIRSQDQEMLIKAVCIYLGSENHEKGCICASSADGNKWYIGKYSTREKALKVLGEIQKLICDYKIRGLFQMPQDDEVDCWGNEVDDTYCPSCGQALKWSEQ